MSAENQPVTSGKATVAVMALAAAALYAYAHQPPAAKPQTRTVTRVVHQTVTRVVHDPSHLNGAEVTVIAVFALAVLCAVWVCAVLFGRSG